MLPIMFPVVSDSTAKPAAALARAMRPSCAKNQSRHVADAPWERHVAVHRRAVELERRRERGRPAGIEDVAELGEARAEVVAEAGGRVRLLAGGESVQRPGLTGGRRQEPPALHVEGARAGVVRRQLEPELARVSERVLVRVEDPDRAQLGVTAALEAVAHGLHAAARAVLRLEHGHVVAVPHQVVGGAQPGQAGAEHDHAPPAAVPVGRGARGVCQRGQRRRGDRGERLQEPASVE